MEEALEAFRPHFGAPAFEHFKRYVVGLIVSEHLTVEGINRIFVEARHLSSLNRFLTVGIWDQHEVNEARITRLKTQGDLAGPGWLDLDDTLTHKTGKKIEGVGIFRDHGEKRYVLAHNIVTVEFVNTKGVSHPPDFRLYFLKDRGLHWVTRLKSDRNIKIRGRYVAIADFGDTLPKESFRKARIGDRTYQLFSKAVDLKGVGQVTILISYDNEEFSGDPAYFATGRIRWEGTRIIKTYAKRWNIETFFKDSKQNLGLADDLQPSGMIPIYLRPE